MAVTLIKSSGGYCEFAGRSTDEKPTDGIATGSVFLAVDTGVVYVFDADNAQWRVL